MHKYINQLLFGEHQLKQDGRDLVARLAGWPLGGHQLECKMAKALFGAEVVILLFLGLSVGVLLFMYVNVKTDLYKVEMNNQVLHKDVMEYVSNTKTSLYKKDLAESDLKRFRDVNKNDEEKIEELTHQLKMLQLQLVR